VATEDDGSSDESSDGEEAETEGASGQVPEKRRARRRATRHLTEALGLSGEPVSFLEAKSLSQLRPCAATDWPWTVS